MIRKLLCPDLLDTGPVNDRIMAVRDGVVNFYILKAPAGLVCIDTGWRPACVSRGFEALGLRTQDVVAVMLTHLHWDHARCLPLFPAARVFVGACDEPTLIARGLTPGQTVEPVGSDRTVTVGGLAVRAINRPGHTPGSMAYIAEDKSLFTGDALSLKRGRVFPFAPWFATDRKALDRSIRKLAAMRGVECLFTAHSGMGQGGESAFAHWHATTDVLQEEVRP